MQRANNILNGMALPRAARQSDIAIRPSKPVVPPPPRVVDVTMCPLCKNAGWTRPDDFDPLVNNKVMLVPCRRCTPQRRSLKTAARQAQLIDQLFGESQIPFKARHWTFDTFPAEGDQHAKAVVEEFVRTHKDGKDETAKRGLYIAGKLGRGKTGLSLCALKEFIEAGMLSLFVSTPELMDRLRASMSKGSGDNQDELLKVVTEVPFLALDDLGVEKPTTYVLEKFYLIIDKRQSRGLYTIFTSNLSTKDLEAYWRPSDVEPGMFHAGMRIIERIREYCQGLNIRGGNLRDIGW